MGYEQILFEQRGSVGLITLNRPEKLNAWTSHMMVEMRSAIDHCMAEPSIAAVVVTGAGRAFCAGADIGGEFQARAEKRERGEADREPEAATGENDWVTYLRNLPKPTIAAINGTAVGIGVTQVLPMDIRIASDQARFGMFFVRMGLVPELASSALLPQMIGSARALEWCLTGRLVPAAEAREAGLISEVVPGDKLLDRALELGELLANNSAPSMVMIRELLRDNGTQSDTKLAMRREGEALQKAYASPEHKEAIAAFFEKRPPVFRR
jgi:2-(1,2-epoxy-1,2-dihydrophenyl)acetyl-CoA isomerase